MAGWQLQQALVSALACSLAAQFSHPAEHKAAEHKASDVKDKGHPSGMMHARGARACKDFASAIDAASRRHATAASPTRDKGMQKHSAHH